MIVAELNKELELLIKQGHGNTNSAHYEKHMFYSNNIYYQSGDIEIAFSDHEED